MKQWGLVKTTLMSFGFAMASVVTQAETIDQTLQQAVKHPQRTVEFAARDNARHPVETLTFFEVKPTDTVFEIWPGGGWYSEILTPYLAAHGEYYAGHFNPQTPIPYFVNSLENYKKRLADNPELYGKVKLVVFDPSAPELAVPAGSADRVLTFRNLHNFYMNGGGDDAVKAALKLMFDSLKKGGILGVVEHRLPVDADIELQKTSGYLQQDYVIKMAESVGFRLVASSEINANPKDTANHPKGVWTLAPNYALGDENRAFYEALGESDRMTLKFVKPQ